MRFKKITSLRLLTLLVLLLLINTGTANTQGNEEMKFSISLEKDVYLVREPVWLEISAVNLTDTDIVVLPLVPYCRNCIQIILKNSQDKVLRYVGDIAHYAPGSPHGVLVKPNKLYENIYDLLDGFGERVNNWGIRHFLKPDIYTVQVLYQHKMDSNILEFKVEEPQGDEEKAFKLLAEGITYLFKKEDEKLIEKLKELVNKYPKSVYADLTYFEMTYWDKDKKRKNENANKIISDYPNSPYVTNAMRYLLAGKNKETRQKILKEWLDKHPGTRAEGYAKQTLENLESKKDLFFSSRKNYEAQKNHISRFCCLFHFDKCRVCSYSNKWRNKA